VALREVIIRHERLVAATVVGILGQAPEVDDIGQETFIRFFRAINRFRGDSRIGTYLVRIAINLSLNELKRRRRDRRTALEAGDCPQEVDGPLSGSGPAEAKALVRQALGRLEPRFRQVIVLRLIDGYSVRETAAFLRLPEGTVLSRLARGLDKLRIVMTDLAGEAGCPGERRIL
jgi:RNA polymerase sigma-70 factor (ECF subfamily)